MRRNVGYTKLHTIKMYLNDWYTKIMLKFFPILYGKKFSDGVVKDGIVEISYPNDDGQDSFWVAKW